MQFCILLLVLSGAGSWDFDIFAAKKRTLWQTLPEFPVTTVK